MQLSKTVVLNCAGLGNRLGLGRTKALIHLAGKPLIHWQLEMLNAVKDIRIVIGFEAKEVINAVLAVRRDVVFVLNHHYSTTKTGFSLGLAAAHTAHDFIISLDGDLLIHPHDFSYFLSLDKECLAYTEVNTEQPCYIEIASKNNIQYVTHFPTEQKSKYEWNGLVQIHPAKINSMNSHVYEMLTPFLPMPAIKVRSQEIDTIADYNQALHWLKTTYRMNNGTAAIAQGKDQKVLAEP
jgi:choline kinase